MPNRQLVPKEPISDWDHIELIEAHSQKEKQAIYRLRYQVQVEEMGRMIPGANHLRKTITDELDDWSYLLYAEQNGRIVCTVRLTIGLAEDFPNDLTQIFQLKRFQEFAPSSPNLCLGTKLMVVSEFRSTPVMFRLMAMSYKIARNNNVQFSFGGCNPYLIPMYEQLGYRSFTAGFQDPGYGFVVPQVILLEDLQHLIALGSPFLRIARKYPNSSAAREWLQVNVPEVFAVPVSVVTDAQDKWGYVTRRVGNLSDIAPILHRLTMEESRQFLQIAAPFECNKGQEFIRTGDVCNELNLLIAGEMRVSDDAGRSWLAGPGDAVGALGLFDQTHHKVDATAVSDCEILAISRFAFEKLLRSQPDLAEKLCFGSRQTGEGSV